MKVRHTHTHTHTHTHIYIYIRHHFPQSLLTITIAKVCNSQNNTRPDVYHPDFLKGRAVYFDVTVRNSVQSLYINKLASQEGAAAAGELEKIVHYEEEVESSGCDVYPLVIESLGVWIPSSLETLKIMARRTVLTTGTTIAKATHYFLQQLSVRH